MASDICGKWKWEYMTIEFRQDGTFQYYANRYDYSSDNKGRNSISENIGSYSISMQFYRDDGSKYHESMGMIMLKYGQLHLDIEALGFARTNEKIQGISVVSFTRC
jgi:hypothetical protein